MGHVRMGTQYDMHDMWTEYIDFMLSNSTKTIVGIKPCIQFI